MLARTSVLFLLAGICCAGAVEPKARPRLPPTAAREDTREAARKARPARESGFTPGFRSFDDFLQAESRRPVGLEAFREIPAARTEAGEADDKGQTSKDTNPSPSRTDPDILVLPKVEITAERLTKLETQLAALEANQSWETSSAEAWDHRTVVDAILNPPFLKLGSYSGSGRAALARKRAGVLDWVRVLTISLEEAKTPADKARIQADIDGLKDIMRMWE